MVKNLPANAGGARDAGSTPGSGRSPGVGHGKPLQCSCLGNPTAECAQRHPGVVEELLPGGSMMEFSAVAGKLYGFVRVLV